VEPGVALFSQQLAVAVFTWPLILPIEDHIARFGAGTDEEFHHSLPMPFNWFVSARLKRKHSPGKKLLLKQRIPAN
jgi:hypothetical protein